MSSSASSTAPYYGNVQFIGVARIAGTGIIVASHAYHTKTDLNGVRQVLEQPNMNMAPGKHYSFNSGELAWHLIAGKNFLSLLEMNLVSFPADRRCWINLSFNHQSNLSSKMCTHLP
jgi:hypothetical protein